MSEVVLERALEAVMPWSRKSAKAEVLHAYSLVRAAAMPAAKPGGTTIVIGETAYRADRVGGFLRVRGMPLEQFLKWARQA